MAKRKSSTIALKKQIADLKQELEKTSENLNYWFRCCLAGAKAKWIDGQLVVTFPRTPPKQRARGRPKSKGEPHSKKNMLLTNLQFQMSKLFYKNPAAKNQTNEEIVQLLEWPKDFQNNTETKRIRVGEAIRYLGDSFFPHLPPPERRSSAIELLAKSGANMARVTENN